MRNIDTIIIHCTATKAGEDWDIDDVRRWHVAGNGWSDVGYHALIRLDGTIEYGRPIARQGAGVKGHNKNSLHVVYVGGLNADGKPQDTMTAAQVRSLYAYVHGVVTVLGAMELIGHNDLTDEKACPSFKVLQKFPSLVAWANDPSKPAPVPDELSRPVRKICRKCSRLMRQ